MIKETIAYCTGIRNLLKIEIYLSSLYLILAWIVGRTLEEFVNYSSPAFDFQHFFVFS